MGFLKLEQHPDAQVLVQVYRTVRNIPDILEKVKKKEVDAVLLDERIGHLQLSPRGGNKPSLHNERSGTMRTRHITTEIILALSSHNNISKSLQTFGITTHTYNVVAVTLGRDETEVMDKASRIKQVIKGDLVNDCRGFQYDDLEISSTYHVTNKELEVASLEDCVVMKIATKT